MIKETQGFNEAYLNECIAKASKTWKGVDVDKYMDEVRGNDDAPTSPDFDTEVYNWLREHGSDETRQLIEMTARHFWEVAQNGGAMLHIADKSYKIGRRDERCKMMKDAVEGFIEEPEYLLWKLHLEHDLEGTFVAEHNLRDGDKVKVIILKAEDEK